MRNRPSWQDYFLGLAILVSKRSHDEQTQHGCILVNDKNQIVGTGYNGFCRGMDDKTLPATRPEKYDYMIHSEVNAVNNANQRTEGSTAYVTGEPCNNCLMHLWQNGITRVVYRNTHGSHLLNEKTRSVRKNFLEQTGMQIEAVEPDLSWLREAIV